GRIGFSGVGAIEDRLRQSVPKYRLGFLLQQSSRELYQPFGKKIVEACHARREEVVDPVIDFVDLWTPENIAGRRKALGANCDAVAVIAADQPVIAQA
ncbi:LacI family transcriptional regulator, partial [Rhizobium ruizarguesonis]